jgi:hypothetical protein
MLSDLLSRTTRMGTRMGIRLLATALCLLGATAAQTQTQAQDGNAPSADTLAYITRLQQQARAQHLADSPTWRSLMHFAVQPLTRQDRSLADDHGFFLSPQGHSDLQAELDATLVALADTRPLYVLEQPAACRFMARQTWLRQQLHIDPQRLPEPECARYQAWREGIRAKTVTLVFPSAYINSPASMYGHTFLRLDPPPTPRGQLPLMSYSVSYAANGSESDGITFAIRGLTGLYDGQFTTSSYYAKLTEYSDLENRDVWEYELDLNDEEVDRMMAHTWELGATRFDYYFFDENCAYHLHGPERAVRVARHPQRHGARGSESAGPRALGALPALKQLGAARTRQQAGAHTDRSRAPAGRSRPARQAGPDPAGALAGHGHIARPTSPGAGNRRAPGGV